MGMQHVTGLVCVECGRRYGPRQRFTCEDCGEKGILDVTYDYEEVARTFDRASLERREPWMWRYKELLPIDEFSELPSLQVGMTPIYGAPRLAEWVGLAGLWLKDDCRNPTGSFKDRASAIGVVKAQEAGKKIIAAASTGNAASSLAGMAAATGLKAVLFVPDDTPEPILAQLLIFGATVFRVKGSYDEAYELCQRAVEKYGWYNRNCAVNPFLIEGKKTCGLEIAEQLAEKMPDWVVVSVGDGCTLAGIHKGLSEMHRLGITSGVPKILGVQAENVAAMADAEVEREVQAESPKTLASSIRVGNPRNWKRAIDAVRGSEGAYITCSDDDIIEAMREMAQRAAIFGEPAGVAGLAGLKRAVARGVVDADATALVVVTGSGMKDIRSAMQAIPPPVDIAADLGELDAQLAKLGLN